MEPRKCRYTTDPKLFVKLKELNKACPANDQSERVYHMIPNSGIKRHFLNMLCLCDTDKLTIRLTMRRPFEPTRIPCYSCNFFVLSEALVQVEEAGLLHKLNPKFSETAYLTYLCAACINKITKDYEECPDSHYRVPVFHKTIIKA